MLRRRLALCATLTSGLVFAAPVLAGQPYLVKDINPGAGWAQPLGLTAVGNRTIFQADDGINGRELWVGDGTPLGTFLVKDIHPTGDSKPPRVTLCKAST